MTRVQFRAFARRSSRPLGAILACAIVVALAACGVNVSRAASADSLHLVAFAGAKAVNSPVQQAWSDSIAADGAPTWLTSYGASGDQSRSVSNGLPADVVHLSLETDMARLVDSGIVAPDWNAGGQEAIATRSVVVLVVRAGNPKNITGWADLLRDDVSVITPNPGSSGAARWNILAAYGSVLHEGGTPHDGEQFLTGLFRNIEALPGSGRDATTSFLSGSADVLISQEQEAIFARQNGEALDYVIPTTTLLVENPAAVTIGADPRAQSYLDFLTGPEGQDIAAQAGFRPSSPLLTPAEVRGAADPADPFPAVGNQLTITADFGGWAQANDEFFGESGLVTRIQQEVGRS